MRTSWLLWTILWDLTPQPSGHFLTLVMIPNSPLSSQEVGQLLISSHYDVTIIISSHLYPWGTDRPQTVSAGEISANHHPGLPHRPLYWLQDYHGNFQTQWNSSDQRCRMEDLSKTKSLCQMFTFCSRQLRTWWPHREAKRPFPWSQHGGYQPSWLSCSSVCYLVMLLQCWWKKYGYLSWSVETNH